MPPSKSFHQLCCSISQIRLIALQKWHKERGLIAKENRLSALLKRRKEEGLEAKEKRAVDRKSNVRADTLEEMNKKNVSFICNYSVGQCPCAIWKSTRVQTGRCEAVAIVRNKAIYAYDVYKFVNEKSGIFYIYFLLQG